jgi:hypothetical protein
MDDEVARSKAKTKPLKGFEKARRQPLPLLLGLAAGLGCAWLAGLLTPVFAPLLPLLVGGPMILFKRTEAVALGVLSAAVGVFVFLATVFLLFWIV